MLKYLDINHLLVSISLNVYLSFLYTVFSIFVGALFLIWKWMFWKFRRSSDSLFGMRIAFCSAPYLETQLLAGFFLNFSILLFYISNTRGLLCVNEKNKVFYWKSCGNYIKSSVLKLHYSQSVNFSHYPICIYPPSLLLLINYPNKTICGQINISLIKNIFSADPQRGKN